MKDYIWGNLLIYLDVIIPIFLPAILILLNYIVKSLVGDFSLRHVGPDISLSGWSLFTVTLLGLGYHKKILPHDIVAGCLVSILLLFMWFICILFAYGRFDSKLLAYSYQPVVSTIIGIPTFYLCCLLTWKILQCQ